MIAQASHYKNGFISHRLWVTGHYDELKAKFAAQDKESDFDRYCRHSHVAEMDAANGIQGNMFRTEIMFNNITNWLNGKE